MKTIAFYNNKGGVGKTSLAVHLALYAEQLKLQVVAAGLDRQGDILRWLSRGRISLSERMYRCSPNLYAVYSPMEIPRVQRGVDLLIADCPPAVQIAAQLEPSVWVVPVTGRLGFENLHNVVEDLRGSDADVIVLLNRKGEGGKRQEANMVEHMRKIAGVTFYERGIRRADAMARTANEFIPVWNDPYAKGVVEDITEFCRFILNRVGIRNC